MRTRATRGDESRTKVIAVRLTPAEHLLISHQAAVAGLTVSAWSALNLTNGRVTVEVAQMPSLQPGLVTELKRIGNNVNQIAAALNSRRSVPAHDILVQMRDLLQALLRDEVIAARINGMQGCEGPKHASAHP